MFFILLLALLLFGPKKLPQMGRELGKALGEFKRASNEFKSQLQTEIAQVEAKELGKAVPPRPARSFRPTIEPRILPPSEPIVAATSWALESSRCAGRRRRLDQVSTRPH